MAARESWLCRGPFRFGPRDGALHAVVPADRWVRWSEAREALVTRQLAERWAEGMQVEPAIAGEPWARRLWADELLRDAVKRGVLTRREVRLPRRSHVWAPRLTWLRTLLHRAPRGASA